MALFVVDTNFFITAYRSLYPLDVFPSYWEMIKKLAENNQIVSIDKVKDEIYHNEDELKDWCVNNLPPSFFQTSSSALNKYSQIANWLVTSSRFKRRATSNFLAVEEADPHLIAFCLENNLTIITNEKSEPTRINRVKIPDVCVHFGVQYLSPIEMFRLLNVKV